MVTSICWNDRANMLAAMQDNSFVVWYHPGIIYADKDLLPLTLITKEGRYVGCSQVTRFIPNIQYIIRSHVTKLISNIYNNIIML